MALFQYEAIDDKGRKQHGVLDAENLVEAKVKLFKQAVFFTQIAPLSLRKKQVTLDKQEVLNWTRELSRLLKAGLPLYESLSAMEEKYRGQKGQPLLVDLCEQVRKGCSFSEALSQHSKTFDLLYISMISNAQKTGRLSAALDEIVILLSKQLEVKKQLINALLYPAILFVFCLFVLGALLFYVVPSLQELFEGRSLHPFTCLVFAASDFARNSVVYLLLFIVLGISSTLFVVFSPEWRNKLSVYVAKLPWMGVILTKTALIRFCRATATLLEGGVPIVASLAQARSTIRHPPLEAVVAAAEQRIATGEPLHASFKDNQWIPPLVPRMLAIAEEAGNLASMLKQIGDIYEEEMERTLTHFGTVAQPALLLLLGAIIGFVLLAVLLPLTDVSSFATN